MTDMFEAARLKVGAMENAPSTADSETRDVILGAQAWATLAVAGELRRLREELPDAVRGALLEALGDGSHLDGLKIVLRDLPDAVERAIGAGLFHGR